MTPEHDDTVPLLDVHELRVGYPVAGHDPHLPVDGLSFQIREREVVGLVGDAGCGKSTAALALLGRVRAPGRVARGLRWTDSARRA